ncbi:poly(A)+ RNA export protein-like [Trifolium pratense]|uniref:poly(A)+ RNA export protein-like n=1 Tax=Trifolium pratense TaxID=57577 RepID=UPI001E69720C|nr:poly(A)+ RNA export protein-like [Trifolium pratense]
MTVDAPIKEDAWIPEMNLLAPRSWDKTIKYWDTRQSNPVHTQQLPDRCYTMSVRHFLMVVGTTDRNLIIFNLQNPQFPIGLTGMKDDDFGMNSPLMWLRDTDRDLPSLNFQGRRRMETIDLRVFGNLSPVKNQSRLWKVEQLGNPQNTVSQNAITLPPFPGRECTIDQEGSNDQQSNLLFGVNIDPTEQDDEQWRS